MKKNIETLRKTRTFVLGLIKDLSVEQLNEIPEGFNNNILWNIAHLIASQQGVCYLRSGLKTFVEEKFFDTYKPGTKPEGLVSASEAELITSLFLSVIDQLEADYNKNVFSNYTPWTTRYGVELNSIDEALGFLAYHEGLHAGYVMALKRMVVK